MCHLQAKAIDDILVEMHGGALSLARVLVATMIDVGESRQVQTKKCTRRKRRSKRRSKQKK
jgi:hypothetical protein